ncbi:hypothetical protein ECG_07272 [Echinococcus granulosus]|nr:hypothetical protein ECG_07272 [Echinococcus granulosus]
MDRRLGYVFVALLAAILFFVAVGYSGWGCGDSILGPRCINQKVHEITGALLLTAGLIIFLAAIFLVLVVTDGSSWTEIVSTVATTVAAIIAIVGVFYYLNSRNLWSPFIATTAMSLTVALAAILLFDLITFYIRICTLFQPILVNSPLTFLNFSARFPTSCLSYPNSS